MITVDQIKAARALLNWNQQDLATVAKMSKTALANIERGAASPRTETLISLRKGLENGGVKFIDNLGVQLKSDLIKVEVFEGNEGVLRLWDDIITTLDDGEERLISCVDEEMYSKKMGKKFDYCINKFKEKNIKGRLLALEGKTDFPDPTAEYRWIDEDRFLDHSYYVYGDKYALLLWEPIIRIVIIENKAIADSYRKQFNSHWEEAIIPPKQ